MNTYTMTATDRIRYEDDKYKHVLGLKYGKLIVLHAYHRIEGRNSRLVLVCKCGCGELTHQRADALRAGRVVSCGSCSHHLSRTRLYYVWRDIKTRCYNEKVPAYKWYGGRGISMCDEWRYDCLSFVEWCHTHGYKPGLQLDRIDNNKGYCPENCRFVTPSNNQRNKSSNRLITFQNETRTLVEWCEILHVSYGLILGRLSKGMSFERAIVEPVNLNQRRMLQLGADGRKHGRIIKYNGEEHTCLEWARIKGMSWYTIQNRLKLGWDVAKIFNTPVRRFRKHDKRIDSMAQSSLVDKGVESMDRL